jgi:hypothetical protein
LSYFLCFVRVVWQRLCPKPEREVRLCHQSMCTLLPKTIHVHPHCVVRPVSFMFTCRTFFSPVSQPRGGVTTANVFSR